MDKDLLQTIIAQEWQEILTELDAIDLKSIRAMRGNSAADKTRLAELEAQAILLRKRL